MSRQRVAAAVVGACGLLGGLLVVPVPVSAAPATTRHIAFTDDRDELRGALLEKRTASSEPRMTEEYDLGEETTHEGEASIPREDEWTTHRATAFVSTRGDDPDGEVYVTAVRELPVEENAKLTVPVTCDNDATESHPVISPDGESVAFASDLGGSWDIYLADRVQETGTCEDWSVRALTDGPGDDLWPAWASEGEGLVFSSTAEDPLADLYYVERDGGEPLRLTDDPGAETQPAVTPLQMYESYDDWIAFTTTRFRPDGSIAFMRLSRSPRENPGEFDSAWSRLPRQSSEPSWAPRPDDNTNVQLAFTSTETDPAGDIWVAEVLVNDSVDEPPLLSSGAPVIAEPGVAESHAAWREGFEAAEPTAALTVAGQSPRASVEAGVPATVDASGSTDPLNQGLTYRFDFGDGSDPVIQEDQSSTQHTFDEGAYDVSVTVTNRLGRTATAHVAVSSGIILTRHNVPQDAGTSVVPAVFVDRGTVPLAAAPSAPRAAVLVYTVRSHDADISDVVAADGSNRRTVVARSYDDDGITVPHDEAGPSYSPDGEWLAYSRDVPYERGRMLVVERVDGTEVVELPAGRTREYVDVDPSWSPDGTQIAFTRYPWVVDDPSYYGWPQVWVVDVSSGSAHTVSTNGVHHDTGPTWSPDGERLALARVTAPVIGRSRGEPVPPPSERQLVVVDADDGGNERRLQYPSPNPTRAGGPVLGDSPAWSADGRQIAFHHRDAIRVIELASTDGAAPGLPETVVTDWSVTGFHGQEQGGPPTESRSTLSATEDPAWSADGNEIAFAGQPAGRPDQRGIYATEPDGTGLRVVAQRAGPETEPTYGELPNAQADVSVEVVLTGSPAQTGEPVTATYTVTNNGPAAARKVRLATTHTDGGDASGSGPGCAADGSGCAPRSLDPGETFEYVVTIEHEEPVEGVARGEVTTATFDPELDNNVDEEPYEVVDETPEADVRVDVEVDRKGWVGGRRTATITVTNKGPDEAEDVELVTTYSMPQLKGQASEPCLQDGTVCALGTLEPREKEVLELELKLLREGTAQVTAVVTTTTEDPKESNNTDEATLKIAQPVLRILPAVGRTGQVVLAYGEEFPPRTNVMLRWKKGLIVHRGPFKVARDGTLRVPLLLVRHDRLGDRELVARSVPKEFSPVRTEVLVVARLLAAPTFLSRG